MSDQQDASAIFNRLEDIVKLAKQRGADAVEVALSESTGLSAAVRLGKVEKIEEGKAHGMSLRLFTGDKAFTISPHIECSRAELTKAIDDALTIARFTTGNPNMLPADRAQLTRHFPTLETFDLSAPPSIDDLVMKAKEAEDVGRQNSLITNSEGASATWSMARSFLVMSNGFAGSMARTGHSLYVSLIGEKDGQMEVDGHSCRAVYAADMESPADIGRQAAERTVAKLGAIKPATAIVPVVFHPDIGASLLGHFANAVNGTAIMFKNSFLAGSLNKAVFAPGVTITDDPLLVRGLASRAFDSEGLPVARLNLVENGVLKTWFLDLEAARELGMAAQGNAMGRNGETMKPLAGPSNLTILPGDLTPGALMADIAHGLYVTGEMSQGVNGLTGDYSVACNGFWIENGGITKPVSQIAMVGNLKNMFLNLRVANDITDMDKRRNRIAVPTLRIDGMTVAGK